MSGSPCLGCPNRASLCHSTCPAYAAYRQANQAMRSIIQAEKHLSWDFRQARTWPKYRRKMLIRV